MSKVISTLMEELNIETVEEIKKLAKDVLENTKKNTGKVAGDMVDFDWKEKHFELCIMSDSKSEIGIVCLANDLSGRFKNAIRKNMINYSPEDVEELNLTHEELANNIMELISTTERQDVEKNITHVSKRNLYRVLSRKFPKYHGKDFSVCLDDGSSKIVPYEELKVGDEIDVLLHLIILTE